MSQEQKKPSGFSFLRTLRSAASSVIVLKNSRKLNENKLEITQNLDTSLKIENFLIEGFKHESGNYMQLLQDRTVTLNIYFILIGITASSLGIAYQFLVALRIYLALSIFLTLLIYGIVKRPQSV